MRLRNWLSLLLLTSWVWAQPRTDPTPMGMFPELPKTVRAKALKKTVGLRLFIEVDGSVKAVLEESLGDAECDRELVEAVERKWKWSPATVDGKPVRSVKRLSIRMEID